MTETKKHNALEILKEARDTIKATFWISGNDFEYAEALPTYTKETDEYTYDWTGWEEVNKFILAKIDNEALELDENVLRNDYTAKITGVCSRGALALANVTLYDMPLMNFEQFQSMDPATFQAGAAIVMEICKQDPKWYGTSASHANIIAEWNDAMDRTRDEVLDIFNKAIASPLATADQMYQVVATYADGMRFHNRENNGWLFATEEEAIAASEAHKVDMGFTWSAVVPFHHPEMMARV